MRNGVFLDTSFLISLVNPAEANHQTATLYYRHFLKERMPMAISAIVVAEFCVKQTLDTLPMEQFVPLPFTHEDAVVAAGLDFKAYQGTGVSRPALKDDFKIIGHAQARGFGYLITGDGSTMGRYCDDLRARGSLHVRAIKLDGGFSLEAFTPDGQSDFGQVLEEEVSQYDVAGGQLDQR
jgi:predicted nucleic acid-binding protein